MYALIFVSLVKTRDLLRAVYYGIAINSMHKYKAHFCVDANTYIYIDQIFFYTNARVKKLLNLHSKIQGKRDKIV